MKFPGEKLVMKLWDTLADKGVGNLLRPWQTRREGRAEVDVQCYGLLAMAQAEREADEIRSGRKRLCNSRFAISLTESVPAEAQSATIEESESSVQQIITTSIVTDTLRKELNVAKAVIHAEDELKDDPAPPPDKEIDPDWLYRWRDYAGSVSSDQLQAIWGRILAGELKSPGIFSFRLMEFVRNLSKEEAEKIEKAFSFAFGKFIPREPKEALEKESISLDLLTELQSFGLVTGADSIGLSYKLQSADKDKFSKLLRCHGKGLLVQHADPTKILTISAIIITDLGRQVMNLGKFTPNKNFIVAVGQRIRKDGFNVTLVDYRDIGNGYAKIGNEIEITQ
jgi:hypothetical protein